MRKRILKILLLFLAFIIIFQINSMAAVIVSSDKQVQSNSGNVTINVTSKQSLGAYTLTLTDTAGLTLVSASTSNGEVSADNKSISGSSATGTTNLGSYTFKVPSVSSDTKYNVKFSITGMETPDFVEIPNESNTATITVKAPVSAPTPTPTQNDKPSNPTPTPAAETKSPDFTTVSKVVYTTTEVNLRESWSTSSSATRVPADTELRLTGTSNEKVNGYVWYRVTYDGKIRYVVKDYIKEKDEEENEEDNKSNANLKSLSIEGVELTPTFNADVTDYTAKLIGYTETKIDVKAEPENEKSSVKIEGNTDVKLGENIIKIIVTAEDGTTKNYTINVTIDETETLGLKTLKIKDIHFKFDPTVFDYEIQFEELDKLEIEAIPNFEDATVEIIGNENLVDGENIITIIVTSADGEETATYQIKANKIVKVEETRQLDMKKVLITALIAFILIVLIATLIVIYVKGNNNSNIDYVYEDNLNIDDKEEIKEETEEQTIEENENKKATVDDLFKDYSNEEELKTSRRGKGKHSK